MTKVRKYVTNTAITLFSKWNHLLEVNNNLQLINSFILKNSSHINEQLLQSEEPSIRRKIRVHVLEENPASPGLLQLQNEIKNSSRVKKLLSNKNSTGKIISQRNVYDKWQGAHWILATLADIGYPLGDHS